MGAAAEHPPTPEFDESTVDTSWYVVHRSLACFQNNAYWLFYFDGAGLKVFPMTHFSLRLRRCLNHREEVRFSGDGDWRRTHKDYQRAHWRVGNQQLPRCKCYEFVFDSECYDAYVFLRALCLFCCCWLLSLLLGYLGNIQPAASGARACTRRNTKQGS